MKNKSPKKQTRAEAAEAACLRDMARDSAFEKVDRAAAKILPANQLPQPLKRFIARERSAVHIRLPAAARRRLSSLSQAQGLPPNELARLWLEQRLAREAG